MKSPGTGYFSLTGDHVVDTLTNGYKWSLDTGRTIDFSVSNGPFGEYWLNPNAVAQSLSAALDTFSPFANIRFNFVGGFVTPQQAAMAGSEINLSLTGSTYHFPSSSIWAAGFFPDPNGDAGYYPGVAGDIYLNINSAANYLPSYAPGSAGWALLLHEIGHTLGLKHPHDDGGTGRPTFSQFGLDGLDLDVFTIMSYDDAADWNLITWDPATPMILDVLALQALYGKNFATNAGDTTHFIGNTRSYLTTWDASGIDTINASRATEGWVIDLPTAAWSSIVDTKVGAAVPISQFTTNLPTTFNWLAGDFENVVGSRFSDRITANQFNNQIFGGGGDDIIDGGLGLDTAFYSGSISRYQGSVGNVNVIYDTLLNGDGQDTLIGIERIKFSDANIALDVQAGENAGMAYRMYKAALNRAPDLEGLGDWIAVLDNGGNIFTDLARGFTESAEFKSLYGSNLSTEAFVTLLYVNVLERRPDQGGLSDWVAAIEQRGATREEVLYGFSESPENIMYSLNLIGQGMQFTE